VFLIGISGVGRLDDLMAGQQGSVSRAAIANDLPAFSAVVSSGKEIEPSMAPSAIKCLVIALPRQQRAVLLILFWLLLCLDLFSWYNLVYIVCRHLFLQQRLW